MSTKQTKEKVARHHLVRPVPGPTRINESEGWSFDYGFMSDIVEECRYEDGSTLLSTEAVDDVLKVLKRAWAYCSGLAPL